MDYETNERIDKCFNGEISRDCSCCPAYKKVCCFGSKYDEVDTECANCIHKEACEIATINNTSYTRPSYQNQINYGQRAQYSNPIRPVANSYQNSYQSNYQSNYTPQTSGNRQPINKDTWEPAAHQLLRDIVWYAATSIADSIFQFLKNHRWM